MRNRLLPEFKEYLIQTTTSDGVVLKMFVDDKSVALKELEEMLKNKKDDFKDMNAYDILTINYDEFSRLEELIRKENNF